MRNYNIVLQDYDPMLDDNEHDINNEGIFQHCHDIVICFLVYVQYIIVNIFFGLGNYRGRFGWNFYRKCTRKTR